MVPARFVVSVFVSVSVSVAPLVFRAPSDPAVGPGCWLCPWAAARPRAVRAASFARRVVSKPGQAPPPPTGTAARPGSKPARALRSLRRPSRRWYLWFWCARPGPAATHGRCSQAPPRSSPVPSGPFGALRAGGPVVLVCPARPRRHSRASPLMLTNFARNSPTTVSNLECASLELQRFQRLLKLPSNELRATFLEPAVSYVLHQRIQECSVFRGPTVPRGCAWFGHSWGVRTSL